MLIKLSILSALCLPLFINAECYAETSQCESGSSFQYFIKEMASMVSQKMNIEFAENLRMVQNATSENILKVVSAMNDQSASVLETVGTVMNATVVNSETLISSISVLSANVNENLLKFINATSFNKETMMLSVKNQSENIDSNIANVIDTLQAVSGETQLKQNELVEAMKIFFNQTINMIVEIERNKSQGCTNAVISENNSEISLLRETLAETNNALEVIKASVSQYARIKLRFTEFNGHIILLPSAFGGKPLTWAKSLERCTTHGTVPFIPRSKADFKYIQKVSTDIEGNGIWLPASDRDEEGVFKWYDGTDASTILKSFPWRAGSGYAGDNNEDHDCVNTWVGDYKLELETCQHSSIWPMLCELL